MAEAAEEATSLGGYRVPTFGICERAFLAEVAGKTDLELGRMARPVVITEHRRIILLSEAVGYPHGTA